ncbi:MAG: SulP family inorganic anion transporter [Solirubrobacteraceae bacterium]|nr:SulP family inorganic anion transporter [Solirubrobacteraceae bacterium]
MAAPAGGVWHSRLLALLPQREDWDAVRRAPGRDVMAGLTVGVVALPLALAFGVTSGLGAQAGLVTAVIAGAIAAVFGGSNLQVSGPTGAMTVVLVPLVAEFGVGGVLMACLMAGAFLLVLALAHVGRFVRYLPIPVVEGFTAGIAIVIALQQLPAVLGVAGQAHGGEGVLNLAVEAGGSFLAHPHPAALLIALGVAATMLLGARYRPGVPFSLVAIVAATLVALVPGLDVAVLGTVPSGIPAPSAGFFDLGLMGALLPAALAIAALAALESLLSATVADGMSIGERHDPDRELFGQALANLVIPFFGGLPSTAAIARTAVNVRAGASSKLAALVHALALAVIMYTAASVVAFIPLSALGGVLLATTARMVDIGALRALARSTHADGLVLALTLVVTVAVDLVTAVGVGVASAAALALRDVARSATIEQVDVDHADESAEERQLLGERIVAYRPEGPLFFGAANRFLQDLMDVAPVEVLILRLSGISTMDATGARMLDEAVRHLERRGITVLLSGISPQHQTLLTTLSVASDLYERGQVFSDTPGAVAHARDLIGARPRITPAG